jgi:hypothetical protein
MVEHSWERPPSADFGGEWESVYDHTCQSRMSGIGKPNRRLLLLRRLAPGRHEAICSITIHLRNTADLPLPVIGLGPYRMRHLGGLN